PVVEPKKADSAPHEVSVTAKELTFLSDAEEEAVALRPTFIDIYRQATDSKGFTNPIYVVPVAWTALSMAFGYRGFVPLA
ncbi:hypothetical protein, partial [Clostridium baratii]|uniref:hypothetical protein n=1 Tax=Clostridium baratii TaxID=1561 RepID=UPI003D34B773